MNTIIQFAKKKIWCLVYLSFVACAFGVVSKNHGVKQRKMNKEKKTWDIRKEPGEDFFR